MGRKRRHVWQANVHVALTSDEALSIVMGIVPAGVAKADLSDRKLFHDAHCRNCGINMWETEKGVDWPDCPGAAA